MTPTLDLALTVAELGLATLRLQCKAPPPADPDPGKPEGPAPGAPPLPTGRPIEARLVEFFRQQERAVLAQISPVTTAAIPDDLSVTDWTGPMTAAMTPIITPYWEESGQRTMAGLGLDPATWEVTTPHIRDKIKEQSFHFCDSTNETTSLKLDAAHAELRKQLEEGIVDRGETLVQLRKRVQTIFTEATESRAAAIAATEASRAVHAAQQEGAKQSGIVSHKSLLISSDACSRCHAVKASEPDGGWPLDDDIATIGDHPYYGNIPYTPIHPLCNCTMVMLVDEALLAAGPELPEGVTPEDVVGTEREPAPEPDLPEYGTSKAKVVHAGAVLGGKESEVRKAARAIFGREADVGDIASAVGAPDDATVYVRPLGDRSVSVAFNGPGYRALRTIERRGKIKVITNTNFEVNPDRQGKGLGAAVFGRQVEQATRLGVARIETLASGQKGSEHNGYVTWPKFGYDGPIPNPAIDHAAEPPPAGVRTVGDLMRTAEGRAWWTEYGRSFEATFDLTPGSQSRRVWDAYRAEKAKMAKAKGRSK